MGSFTFSHFLYCTCAGVTRHCFAGTQYNTMNGETKQTFIQCYLETCARCFCYDSLVSFCWSSMEKEILMTLVDFGSWKTLLNLRTLSKNYFIHTTEMFGCRIFKRRLLSVNWNHKFNQLKINSQANHSNHENNKLINLSFPPNRQTSGQKLSCLLRTTMEGSRSLDIPMQIKCLSWLEVKSRINRRRDRSFKLAYRHFLSLQFQNNEAHRQTFSFLCVSVFELDWIMPWWTMDVCCETWFVYSTID